MCGGQKVLKMGSSRDGSDRRESERDATGVGSGEDEGETMAMNIPWTVPLSQFQVDQSLYHPKPTLYSPVMTTPVRPISLDWQLALSQARSEAKLSLIHKTKGIPNLGVQYTAYAERKDGGRGKLDALLRQSLATYDTNSSILNPKTALVRRYLHPGNSVKLSVVVRISRTRFHPMNLLNALIEEERKSGNDYEDGVVGLSLYGQISDPTVKDPMEADLVFLCPNGERVFAHKAVLAAFSPRFKEALKKGTRKGRWTIQSQEISASSLREVLHFIYLRKTSPNLYKASLNEVLEAARLFQQPSLLKLEVEKLLVLIINADNAIKMWHLAMVYGLDVITNMVLTLADERPVLKAALYSAKEALLRRGDLPALAPPPSFSVAS